jgi:hypothetical protein
VTTSRRVARAATLPLTVQMDGQPPRELYDADAAVWHDRSLFMAYIGVREPLTLRRRFEVDTHPANRRARVAEAWAERNGVTNGDLADWHWLRNLGLIEPTRSQTWQTPPS